MTRSAIVLAAAHSCPWLFRPVVQAAFYLHPTRSARPHWLLREMKEQLNVRVSRRTTIDGFVLELDPFDGLGGTLWRDGLTEQETRNVVTDVLGPGMVMMDVGAYVGQFSLVAARITGGMAHVYAIEPTGATFKQLERNTKTNGYSACITCIRAAVSDASGTAALYSYPGSHDQNSLRPISGPDASCERVPLETIDALVSRYQIGRIDLMKIDVEGNEHAVIRGARLSLSRFKPTLIVEISKHQRAYGHNGAEVRALLTSLGYSTLRFDADAGAWAPYEPAAGDGISNHHFNVLAVHGAQSTSLI